MRSSTSASAETLRGPRGGNVSVTVQAAGLEMFLGNEDVPLLLLPRVRWPSIM